VIGRGALAWPGAPIALASAALFGASTPLAKLLLGRGMDPWLLAGLLYLGAGIGLAVMELARCSFGRSRNEAPLRRKDLPWLALITMIGGILAPVLLMLGLARTVQRQRCSSISRGWRRWGLPGSCSASW
jgi:drug/metabolite transporter (DMT)-like permease